MPDGEHSYSEAPDAAEAQAFRKQQAAEGRASRRRAAERQKHAQITTRADGTIAQVATDSLPPAERPAPPQKKDRDPAKVDDWNAMFLKNLAAAKAKKAQDGDNGRQSGRHAPLTDEQMAARIEQSRQAAVQLANAKTAKLDQMKAEIQQTLDQSNVHLTSGGHFPTMVDLLNSPGDALKAMELLDAAKVKAWVMLDHKQTDTREVVPKWQKELLRMTFAVDHIVNASLRDLTKIIQGHQGSDGQPDLLHAVQRKLQSSTKGIALAEGSFSQDPPAFRDGMHNLLSAMHLVKDASESVSDWSGEVIAKAQTGIDVCTNVRNGCVDLLGALVVVAAAPLIAAGSISLGGATFISAVGTGAIKTLLSASDYAVAGKEIPAGELTIGFLIDVATSMLSFLFKGQVKAALEKEAENWLLEKLAAKGVSRKAMNEVIEGAMTETYGIAQEECKSVAEIFYKERPKDKEKMVRSDYYIEEFKKHFTTEHLTEILQKRLWDRVKDASGDGAGHLPIHRS